MSGRRHKQTRDRERRAYLRRFLSRYIGELRRMLKRRWPDHVARYPQTRRPCSTCAFNPSTDTWPGFETTVFELLTAIDRGRPFYCHEDLPTNHAGEWCWDAEKAHLCAGWAVVAIDPATRDAPLVAAGRVGTPPKCLRKQHKRAARR